LVVGAALAPTIPAAAPTTTHAAPVAAALSLKDEMAINSLRGIRAAQWPHMRNHRCAVEAGS
jgi:hypothetical protein